MISPQWLSELRGLWLMGGGGYRQTETETDRLADRQITGFERPVNRVDHIKAKRDWDDKKREMVKGDADRQTD